MNDVNAENRRTLTAFETKAQPTGSGPGEFWRWPAISKDIWGRIGLLFIALCLIKLVMLAGFRKYLFETHWRVSGQPMNWLNDLALYFFAALVGLHLWRMGTRCAVHGVRVVRAANACMLALGGLFILFTFQEGGTNYLSPFMQGTLTGAQIGSYLAMDLFFRPPYLAAWIFLYAAGYYLLIRARKEGLVLRMTALFGCVHAALCLGALKAHHDALILVDCVGLACLLASRKTDRGLGGIWTASLLAGAILVFGFFYGLDPKLTLHRTTPQFVVLTAGSLVLVGGVTILAWRRQFLKEWSWALPFALVAFVLLLNGFYIPAANYNNLLCSGLTWPRYFLDEFALAVALLIAAAFYRQWRPSGALWWLDIVSLSVIAWALADLRLSQIMGTRLDWQALSLAIGETPRMMWRMAAPYLPAISCVLLLAIGLNAGFLRSLRGTDGHSRWQRVVPSLAGIRFFVLAFVLLGVAGTWLIARDKVQGHALVVLAKSSPVWRGAIDPPMDRKKFIETALRLGMDQLVKPSPPPTSEQRDLNVVLVLQESTFNQHLSLFSGTENTQPLLSNYKERMEVFPNFFATFAGSIHARFATFAGLYPTHDFQRFTSERVPVKSMFEILHESGYNCSMFYSSYFDYTGFRDFLRGRNLDAMYDADTMPGERRTAPVSWGLREEETLQAIQAQIKRYAARKEKFFLTYIPAAPHNPFDGTPARFRKYRKEYMGDHTPSYLNELLYMDWIISSIVDELRDSGVLDNTLVIITSDHGEMLGADGTPVGHGWSVTPELANVPLIIMDPAKRGYRVNPTVGSHVDLLPTIRDLLGITNGSEQFCQGTSLYSLTGNTNRTIYLDSFHQYGVVKGRHLICGDRGAEAHRVYRIENEGSRTTFVKTNSVDFPSIPILQFDKFQENFLHHFSRYSLVRQEVAVVSP